MTKQVPDFHPLAAIDPLMDGADFTALVEDIRQHGLREPVVLYKGKILDGRNRARACIEAGVELQYKEIAFGSDAEAAAYLDSANLHRRHLTPEQKNQRIAARLKANPTVSDRQVAKQTGASHTTVTTVRHELEQSGDVAKVATSTDTRGRKQPRHRSKPAKAKPARAEPQGVEPTTEPAVKTPPAAQGVGPYSEGEHDRLRARIDELNAEKRQLEIKIGGLESEVEELKARIAELEARIATSTAVTTVTSAIPRAAS